MWGVRAAICATGTGPGVRPGKEGACSGWSGWDWPTYARSRTARPCSGWAGAAGGAGPGGLVGASPAPAGWTSRWRRLGPPGNPAWTSASRLAPPPPRTSRGPPCWWTHDPLDAMVARRPGSWCWSGGASSQSGGARRHHPPAPVPGYVARLVGLKPVPRPGARRRGGSWPAGGRLTVDDSPLDGEGVSWRSRRRRWALFPQRPQGSPRKRVAGRRWLGVERYGDRVPGWSWARGRRRLLADVHRGRAGSRELGLLAGRELWAAGQGGPRPMRIRA